eukprot:1845688-Prorocentrum_lima.AAC.1
MWGHVCASIVATDTSLQGGGGCISTGLAAYWTGAAAHPCGAGCVATRGHHLFQQGHPHCQRLRRAW